MPYRTVACSCSRCGTAFETRPAYIRRGDGKFCSRSCAAQSHELIPTDTRFWGKVAPGQMSECWLWLANRSAEGYGQFWLDGRGVFAHRVAWALTNGPIPAGLWVLHNCPTGDNPACVNPSHLFLGTARINTVDMVRKGRCPVAKLTLALVDEMRSLYRSGAASQAELAVRYGVHGSQVSRIVNGKVWKSLAEAS